MRDVKAQWNASRGAQPAPSKGGPAAALDALRSEIEQLLTGASDAQELSTQYAALREQLMQILPALQQHAATMQAQPDISAALAQVSAEVSDVRAMVGQLSGRVDELAKAAQRRVTKDVQYDKDGRIARVVEERT